MYTSDTQNIQNAGRTRKCVPSLFCAILSLVTAPALAEKFDLQRAVDESGFEVPVLRAIAMIESGRPHEDGVRPTPWVVRADDRNPYFESREQAESALYEVLALGRRNVDVGLMQVNILWNGDLVNNPGDLLDPRINLWAATQVINDCRARVGHNTRAVLACYHAGPSLPDHGWAYADRVLRRAYELGWVP